MINETKADNDTPQLDAEVVGTYRERGFVRLPGLYTAREMAAVVQHLDRVVQEVVPRMDQADYVLEPGGHAVRNFWRLERYDTFFAELGNGPRILSIVEQLLGATAVLVAVETFNKPARQGSAVPPHQDNAYFCQDPPDVLTVWVAIDPTTTANGPVNYVAHSKTELLSHKGSGIPGNSMVLREPEDYDSAKVEAGLLNPGDAMVHHSQTVHWSEPNHSDQARRGMLLVYRAAHTQTSTELRNRYDAAQAEYAART